MYLESFCYAMPTRFLFGALFSSQSWGQRFLLRLQHVPRCPGVPGKKAVCCENEHQHHSTDSSVCNSQFLTCSARKQKKELQCNTCTSGINCCGLQTSLNFLDYCFFSRFLTGIVCKLLQEYQHTKSLLCAEWNRVGK